MSAKIGVSTAASMASQAIGRLGTTVEQAGEMGRTWEDCSVRVIVVHAHRELCEPHGHGLG